MNAQPPWPLVEIAIKANSADRDTLGAALGELATADTTLRVSIDRDSGQTLLGGTDETHLSGTIDVLRRDYEIDATFGEPRDLRVTTPNACAAEVLGELKGRGALIQGADQAGDAVVIMARIPLAHMFGYGESPRASGAARASFLMAYEGYAPL